MLLYTDIDKNMDIVTFIEMDMITQKEINRKIYNRGIDKEKELVKIQMQIEI